MSEELVDVAHTENLLRSLPEVGRLQEFHRRTFEDTVHKIAATMAMYYDLQGLV